MDARIAIYGCGGFAREIAPIIKENFRLLFSKEPPKDFIVFISDFPEKINKIINGIQVISYEELLSPKHKDRKVIVSIADPMVRKDLVTKCTRDNFDFASCMAITHKRMQDVTIAEGAVFCDFTLCTSNIKIGKHFQCNIYSYVAHDCVIGDFVTFAPRVNCNGNIIIEDDVYVGTGAIIRQGNENAPLIIGRGAIIGMGAVVTKNVEPYSVIYGNPATVKRYTQTQES